MNQSLTHCPKCKSTYLVKAGFAYGKQRHRCKDCNHYFTVMRKSTKKSDATKQMAIKMYLEGLGFRAIGRLLDVSHQTAYRWVRQVGEQHKSNLTTVKTLTLWSLMKFIVTLSTKNYCWTPIAIDRDAKQILGFVCGKRDTNTFKRLYNNLNSINIKLFCSDCWKSYQEVIPKHKHLKSKAQTFTIEGCNSRIRHYLVRFKRKTKCYSKCQTMIENSLNLLFAKWGGRLSIV